MMELLLNLSASFSVMERKLTKLISDVSDIKEKQDSLQLSLSFLNRSRAAEMEHQRGLPSTKQGIQHPCGGPSTSSTPRKSTAWYMTDSFAEHPVPDVLHYQLYMYNLKNSEGSSLASHLCQIYQRRGYLYQIFLQHLNSSEIQRHRQWMVPKMEKTLILDLM